MTLSHLFFTKKKDQCRVLSNDYYNLKHEENLTLLV